MELPPVVDNRILFLDMNAFFASCEQWRDPSLRGRPVGVTPTLANSGCVIAASYEAKRLGVTTGCSVGEAKARIPSIRIVESKPKNYVAVHKQIVHFLETAVAPDVNRLSIDEFAISLDKSERWTPNAHAVAVKIKRFLATTYSGFIRCSIGIGPNAFLAKLATDIEKPDGLAIVQTHTLEDFYRRLALRDLPGIHFGLERRLNILGARTPLEFYSLSQPRLKRALGVSGTAWWYALRGYAIGAILPGSAFGFGTSLIKTRSVGHSHVLAPNLRTKAKARAVLYKLWIKVAERLRAKKLGAQAVWMAAESKTDHWSARVIVLPTQNVFAVWRVVARDYDRLPDSFSPLQARVVAFDLELHDSRQPKLWPDAELKVARVFAAVTKTNDRYGRWTLAPASMLTIAGAAPNRIAFHAPDYEMN